MEWGGGVPRLRVRASRELRACFCLEFLLGCGLLLGVSAGEGFFNGSNKSGAVGGHFVFGVFQAVLE